MGVQKQEEWRLRSNKNKARLGCKGYAQEEGINHRDLYTDG